MKLIEKFNRALRTSSKDKFYELREMKGVSDVVLYRFDLARSDKEQVDAGDLEKNIPQDNIEYFWIEYNKDGLSMKLALFFRDIDANSHNVHVIPGLFEEYELKDEIDPSTPHVVVENGKAVIKNVGSGCPSFAEPCDNGGWWIPKDKYIPSKNRKVTKDPNKTIENFEGLFQEFRDFEDRDSNKLKNYLVNNINGLKLKKSGGNTEKYKIVSWYNIVNQNYTMDLFKILYFPNYGFFTQYNCINFTSAGKDIVTNYPIVEKDTEKDYSALKSPISLSGELDLKEIEKYFESFMNKQ